jgi:hypothetical protein
VSRNRAATRLESFHVPPFSEMRLPLALFFLFAVLSVVGAFLAVASWRGRKAGVVAALLTVFFFGVLATGVYMLLRTGGVL